MTRPSLDDLKMARDGTLHPIIPQEGRTVGEEAYLRARKRELERLRADLDDLAWEEREAMARADECRALVYELEQQIEELEAS